MPPGPAGVIGAVSHPYMLAGAIGLALALAVGVLGCAAAGPEPLARHPRPPATATTRSEPASEAAPGQAAARLAAKAFPMSPASGHGYLAPGSDPRALPGDVLIADENNNRLLLVDPFGRVRWQFPGPGNVHHGPAFGPPDDAFISPDSKMIVATQEMVDTVSVIDVAAHRVTRRYGHPGVPGSAAGFFSHPDDAMLLPGGDLLMSDIMNCRILILAPGRWHVLRQLGTTSSCGHHPPALFGSPNGVFPLSDGHFLVTEISGNWVDEIDLHGHVHWSAHPPGVSYPSDANQAGDGRYIVADYSFPGQIVIFNRAGRVLWRFRPRGANALNHPSLALPLPNGNILVNDDFNDRVIVIDPKTNRIVWQYGHRGVPGRAAGFLSNPDGVDMAPPYSLLVMHAPTLGWP